MAGKLTTVKVRALTAPGRYGDGRGLWLQVRDAQRRSWLFRFKLHGRERAMGLGAVEDVSLADAREQADVCRKLLRQGIDPIEHRIAERAAKVAVTRAITFREVANRYIEAHKAGWRNAKHVDQWRNTLATYAFPVFGDTPVAAVDTGAVVRVLEPIWSKKTETASRLRGRIENVLDYAVARGWRQENPARWRGHLQKLLPARSKVQRVEHHAALPWRQMGAFMATLREQDGVAARALEFAILTAARTGEVIGARWEELNGDVWTVPGERMKAGREHRVPLSPAALAVLTAIESARGLAGSFVFAGGKKDKPLSSMALLMLLRRMGRGDLTVHGFRSTFREWAAEATAYPREVAELALAHVNKDKVEAAYQRGDLFEKRRRLMADWAEFCDRVAVSGEIVSLRSG